MFFKKNKKIIGRLVHVDIPELDLYQIPAKIDTGAYRGAIHVNETKEIVEDGVKKLQFKIVNDEHPELKEEIYKVTKFKTSKFKGTQTELHDRYIVSVDIKIAGEVIKAEISLTNRSGLRYPILIGRRALRGKFLVDVDKEY